MIKINFAIKYSNFHQKNVMEIDLKIKSIKDELLSIEKAGKRRHILIHIIEDLQDELSISKSKMDSEYQDVLRLEKLSTATIYHKILGNIGSAIEKEKEDYLLAVLHYDDLSNKLNLLEYEINILTEKISKKQNLTIQLSDLLTSKEGTIKEENDHTFYHALKRMNDKITSLKQIKIEITEASIAAEKLESYLDEVAEGLKKIDPWFDFSANQQYTSYTRLKYQSGARQIISMIDHLGKNLNEELTDISNELNVKHDLEPYIDFVQSIHKAAIDGWHSGRYLERAKNCIKDYIAATLKVKLKLLELNQQADRQITIQDDEKKLYLENG